MAARKVLTSARYILADVNANANKHWDLRLFEDGELVATWGRVGTADQTKSFGHFPLPAQRDKLFRQKCREKEAKGYVQLQVVDTPEAPGAAAAPGGKPWAAAAALAAATRDILGAAPPAPAAAPAPAASAAAAAPAPPPPPAEAALERLVRLLVRQNVHDVAAASGGAIVGDASGLFRTPLGIVTEPALARARALLALMAPLVAARAHDHAQWPALLSEYLTLVPRAVGRERPSPARLFPDAAALLREHQLLDSLAGSLQVLEARRQQAEAAAVAAAAGAAGAPGAPGAPPPPPPPRLFDVSLRLIAVGELEAPGELSTEGALWPADAAAAAAAARAPGAHVFRSLRALQAASARPEHPSARLRLLRAYRLTHHPSARAFSGPGGGAATGNVMRLWHGSRVGNLLSILRSGLVVPPASSQHVTGRLFGDGVYTSSVSTKALNYALGAAPGQGGRSGGGGSGGGGGDGESESYFALLADVAMGRVHHPAAWGRALPAAGSDSTWARARECGLANDEMIVYRASQVNPVFLGEFKAKDSAELR